MSSGYRALLQSLDETEKDVTRGLGHQIKIKKRPSCCRSCCCCCCRGSNNACLWTCVATVIVSGLILSIGVPILLTVPVESNWHWMHWLDFWKHSAENITTNSRPDRPSLNATDEGYENGTDWSSASVENAEGDLGLPEAASNATDTFMQKAITQLHQMMEWAKEQYDNTPKVPLIIGLSALLLVILTITWLFVYRKIRRRQRRRTIGKLVTDLQSGKTLLNSDDSEED